MGINSIFNFFKIPDDDYEYEDEKYEYEEEPVKKRKAYSQPEPVYEEQPKQRASILNSKPKVVPMANRANMQVNIVKPSSFEDSQSICNTLLSGRPVVVNLEGFDADDAQRVMDFISGCIYAIRGQYQQISKYIFLFTPENVDIDGGLSSSDGDTMMPTLNREF